LAPLLAHTRMGRRWARPPAPPTPRRPLGLLPGRWAHSLRTALRHLPRLVQRGGAELAALTVNVWAPASHRAYQRLDRALLGTTGRPPRPTRGTGHHALRHGRSIRLVHHTLRHFVGPLLPAREDRLGPRFQARWGVLHTLLPCLPPLLQAVVQPRPILGTPLGVAALVTRQDRCAGHRPVLPRSKVWGIFPPLRLTGGAGSCVLKNKECSHIRRVSISPGDWAWTTEYEVRRMTSLLFQGYTRGKIRTVL
jgi:hypothetical protein